MGKSLGAYELIHESASTSVLITCNRTSTHNSFTW